ncbi:DNA replication/repair protein RecF [Rhodothermus sp. AH-315-K08]|nr:DNA replication/repair protein RecF [Rhodothermus sp. AH-315-K08]
MQIRSIHIRGLRAHEDSEYAFSEAVNLLHGPNGIGKTNVLEAIYYACLSKSFITSSDRHVLRIGSEFLQVDAQVTTDRRGEQTIRLVFVPGEGKRVWVNGVQLERLIDLVGLFPVVVLAPADHKLTEEGPDERRRFLDTMLCQASPSYLQALVDYRRVLKQRNELLSRRSGMGQAMLAPYNDALARHGSRLVLRRATFIKEFCHHLDDAFTLMAGASERPSIAYRTFLEGASELSEDELVARYLGVLSEKYQAEVERGLTLVGPHRDDLVFRLDDLLVRRYASQGQHRTFVTALKLAQYFYLTERLEERPVLLLDDAFDTLDPRRMQAISDILGGDRIGQSLVTAARKDIFENAFRFEDDSNSAISIRPEAPVPTS